MKPKQPAQSTVQRPTTPERPEDLDKGTAISSYLTWARQVMSDPVRNLRKRFGGCSLNLRHFKDTPTATGNEPPRRLRDDTDADFAAEVKILIMNFVMSRQEGQTPQSDVDMHLALNLELQGNSIPDG